MTPEEFQRWTGVIAGSLTTLAGAALTVIGVYSKIANVAKKKRTKQKEPQKRETQAITTDEPEGESLYSRMSNLEKAQVWIELIVTCLALPLFAFAAFWGWDKPLTLSQGVFIAMVCLVINGLNTRLMR